MAEEPEHTVQVFFYLLTMGSFVKGETYYQRVRNISIFYLPFLHSGKISLVIKFLFGYDE